MFKCKDCGFIAEQGITYAESGKVHSEVCPYCGGTFEPAVPCSQCGDHHLTEELVQGICMSCLLEKVHDPSFMSEYLEKFLYDAEFMEAFVDDNNLWTDIADYVNNF